MQAALFGDIIKIYEEDGNKEIFTLYRKMGGINAHPCALPIPINSPI